MVPSAAGALVSFSRGLHPHAHRLIPQTRAQSTSSQPPARAHSSLRPASRQLTKAGSWDGFRGRLQHIPAMFWPHRFWGRLSDRHSGRHRA